MGFCNELYAEIFIEPEPTPEEVQAHLEEDRERKASYREEFESRRPDQKERDLLVKEKCARAAQILRAKTDRESR